MRASRASVEPAPSAAAGDGVMFAFGVVAVLLVMPRHGQLGRLRGAAMLACYGLYVAGMGVALGMDNAH